MAEWTPVDRSHLLAGTCTRCPSPTLAAPGQTTTALCGPCRETGVRMTDFSAPDTRQSAPEVPRNRWGWYRLPHPKTGVVTEWPRTTTVIGELDGGAPMLAKWKQRMTAAGLARRPALLAGVAAVADPQSEEGKRTLDRLCEEALQAAGGTDGREMGTALHALTEAWDAGLLGGAHPEAVEASIPEAQKTDVLAYHMIMERFGLRVVEIERPVVNVVTGTAGMFDRIVRCPDGKLRILDLKTEKDPSYNWLKISAQLANYARADAMYAYETTDGASSWEASPMPAVDRDTAIVIHLRPGTGVATPYTVDLVQGWNMMMTAAGLRNFRKAAKGWATPMPLPGSGVIGQAVANMTAIALEARPVESRSALAEPMTAGMPVPLKAAIAEAKTRDELHELWMANQDVWTDELTALGMEVLARAEQAS